jgi:hypothetical protein
MVQVVAGSTAFQVTPRMVMSIKVSDNQEFTCELCEEFIPYHQLDRHLWLLVT